MYGRHRASGGASQARPAEASTHQSKHHMGRQKHSLPRHAWRPSADALRWHWRSRRTLARTCMQPMHWSSSSLTASAAGSVAKRPARAVLARTCARTAPGWHRAANRFMTVMGPHRSPGRTYLAAQRVEELLVERLAHNDGLRVANVALQPGLQLAVVRGVQTNDCHGHSSAERVRGMQLATSRSSALRRRCGPHRTSRSGARWSPGGVHHTSSDQSKALVSIVRGTKRGVATSCSP